MAKLQKVRRVVLRELERDTADVWEVKDGKKDTTS